MTNEEYRNLKLQAHQQLVEDYHWLMSQSPAQYTWRCPQRWLIELVYNANQDRPVDEWQRDIPLCTVTSSPISARSPRTIPPLS